MCIISQGKGGSSLKHPADSAPVTTTLRRQKLLLALLEQCPAPLGKIKLVKLAFLAGKETSLSSDGAYYDFVPYKFGPFSFALYHELASLGAKGFLRETEDSVLLREERIAQRNQAVGTIPARLLGEIDRIVREYEPLDTMNLVRRVYNRYPWYASRSELEECLPSPKPEAPVAAPGVFTVGYQGRSIDDFMNHLLVHGIRGILDVRSNPASRKYGFSMKTLKDVAGRLGLDYVNLPELGIPGDLRIDLDGFASYQALFCRYESEILPMQKETINRVRKMLEDRPLALLCMEREPEWCHRGHLATHLAKLSNLPIHHL